MAVSKRLRYEILRRDNFACRYCGAAAPDVKLNADHVIPKSLGGSDKPENLVASCADCNAGKTSSMPNAMVVADVDQETFRRAAELKQDERKKPTHDPETGMPTCWSYRDVELALVEDAWQSAWSAVTPDGPSLSEWEEFSAQRQLLADRGVHIGVMLAAAAMAGSQKATHLTWGVLSRVGSISPADAKFALGCDVVFAWETAWEEAASERPPWGAGTLFSEEVTAAIEAGHESHILLAAAKTAGVRQSFYLPDYLPKIQAAGGEL